MFHIEWKCDDDDHDDDGGTRQLAYKSTTFTFVFVFFFYYFYALFNVLIHSQLKSYHFAALSGRMRAHKQEERVSPSGVSSHPYPSN